jgi:hypothetical protein
MTLRKPDGFDRWFQVKAEGYRSLEGALGAAARLSEVHSEPAFVYLADSRGSQAPRWHVAMRDPRADGPVTVVARVQYEAGQPLRKVGQ